MRIIRLVFVALILAASCIPEVASAYQSKRVSTPEDIAAIQKVIDDFQLAIKNKSGRQLAALVINSRVLFTSPGDQAAVDRIRGFDPNFDGVSEGGFPAFARYISTTKDKIEERFYNVEIVQDRSLAWVSFDFEFYENDKVDNVGVEHWQLHKTDGRWKIFSVIWSGS